MKGTLEGRTIRLGEDGRSLFEQGGYGRPEEGGLRLDPHEALYLVHRQKVEVSGHSFDTLLSLFSRESGFLRAYLVYRDLRERGYAVQSGPQDFRVYRRGERAGTGESRYLVRVLSERDLIRFEEVREEVATSNRMRKQFIHAVVDDEDEITYYEVHTLDLPVEKGFPALPPFEAVRVGMGALVRSPPPALREQWYGKSLDPERILLSAVETWYLVNRGSCSLHVSGEAVTAESFFSLASEGDAEFGEKAQAYADLRTLGYIPKTGYKFGHHFRVYREGKTHSEMLVQAIPVGGGVPMNLIARSVRLSHSVKKKMLFACLSTEGTQYIEFGRIKL